MCCPHNLGLFKNGRILQCVHLLLLSFLVHSLPGQVGGLPNQQGQRGEERDVAQHEQRVRELLNDAEHGQLGGIVGRNVEHAQIIAGLAGISTQVQLIHQDVANDGGDDKS